MKSIPIGQKIYTVLWKLGFWFAAQVAKRDTSKGVTRLLMHTSARISLFLKHGKHQATLEEVAREWQRMFPSLDFNKLNPPKKNTVYAAVEIRCPLRGSGNVLACWRMMEYDRAMLRKIGGKLVVLESQAEQTNPPREVCKVAIRLTEDDMSDLPHAHL